MSQSFTTPPTLDLNALGLQVAAQIAGSQRTHGSSVPPGVLQPAASSRSTAQGPSPPKMSKLQQLTFCLYPNFASSVYPCEGMLQVFRSKQWYRVFNVSSTLTMKQLKEQVVRDYADFLTSSDEVDLLYRSSPGKSTHEPMVVLQADQDECLASTFKRTVFLRPRGPTNHGLWYLPLSSLCMMCTEGGIFKHVPIQPGMEAPYLTPQTNLLQNRCVLQNLKYEWFHKLTVRVTKSSMRFMAIGSEDMKRFAIDLRLSNALYSGDTFVFQMDRDGPLSDILDIIRHDNNCNSPLTPQRFLDIQFRGEQADNMYGEMLTCLVERLLIETLDKKHGYTILEGRDDRKFFRQAPSRRSALGLKRTFLLAIRSFLSSGQGIGGLSEVHKDFILGKDYRPALSLLEPEDIYDEDVRQLFSEIPPEMNHEDLKSFDHHFMKIFGEASSASSSAAAKEEVIEHWFVTRLTPELGWMKTVVEQYHLPAIFESLEDSESRFFPLTTIVTKEGVRSIFDYPFQMTNVKFASGSGTTITLNERQMILQLLGSISEGEAKALLFVATGDTNLSTLQHVDVKFTDDRDYHKGSPVYFSRCGSTVYFNTSTTLAEIINSVKFLIDNPMGLE